VNQKWSSSLDFSYPTFFPAETKLLDPEQNLNDLFSIIIHVKPFTYKGCYRPLVVIHFEEKAEVIAIYDLLLGVKFD
jgi:hypothetical protein